MPQDQHSSRTLRYTREPVYQDFPTSRSTEIVPSSMEREVVMNLRVNYQDIELRMLAYYFGQYPNISRVWADGFSHPIRSMRLPRLAAEPEPPAFELDI